MKGIVLCQLALLGHLALCIGLFNRLHAQALPRWILEVAEKAILTGMLGGLALAVAAVAFVPNTLDRPLEVIHGYPAAAVYFWLCNGTAAAIVALWVRRTCRRQPPQLVGNHRQILDVARHLGRLPCGDPITRFLAHLPANQILQLEINEKTLRLPQLPAALDGLRIAHLSDLHFTGKFTREFFALVVDRANLLQPDLVAVTGDIIDRRACLPWLGEVLGRLQSELGVYCILGNHEAKLRDKAAIVDAIRAAGMHYLGGDCTTLAHRGHTLLLAGNELPWWGPAADMDRCLAACGSRHALRLLLAHTPDQIGWARRYDFDLMLAGHTHGGQIRPPGIGPIICQSRHGVRYSSGVFSVPPTLLHVSRGISGCQPLRINCRPELVVLILRGDAADESA